MNLIQKTLKYFNSQKKGSENQNRKEKDSALSGNRITFPNNSNLPIVQNWSKNDSGMLRIGYDGYDMTLPLLIEQSIYESPAHKSCVKLKTSTTCGNGYELTSLKEIDVKTRMDIIKIENELFEGGLKKFIEQITKDYFLHNRINVKVDKKNHYTTFARVSPARIGYNLNKTLYYYSPNFLFQTFDKVFPKFNGQKNGSFMTDFDGVTDKYTPYAVPDWMSGFQHVKLSSLIPSFHEENMENSIGANMVILRPTEFTSKEEKDMYINALKKEKGVKGTGNVIVLSANGKENLAEIKQLEPNKNDGLFRELRENTIDDIATAHGVNPVLIGVKTAGSLGANQEFDIAYRIFYSVEVKPAIEHIEHVVNTLLKFVGLSYIKFKLNENDALKDLGANYSQNNTELKK